MVFEIKVPDLPAGHSQEAWAHVVQLWQQLLSYGVSFIAVGLFWVGHHQMYHMIRRSSRPLLWLNLLIFGTLNYAQWFYVTRVTHHVIDAVTGRVMREVDRRILFGPCVCVVAILVALVNQRLSELIYLLMLI